MRGATISFAAVGVTVALVSAAPAHAALGLSSCRAPAQRGFLCGKLRVPLDRAGLIPGTLSLPVAVERPRKGARGLLVALSGGPGQSSVLAAAGFRATLRPMLRRRRLVVFDQRGTGAGALRCDALQRTRALAAISPAAIGACGRALGVRRARFATADTVADIEALRVEFGVARAALMGVSYGTFVALQYARRHPDRVERLVLDSPVPPAGIDPFLIDTYARLPRILREQCLRPRCAAITTGAVGDARAVAATLVRRPLVATAYDARGRRRSASLRSAEELALMLLAGDVNPFLQAAFPGALAAARAGDPAALVRLRRVAAGGRTPRRELSVALNVATLCADVRLPYAPQTAPGDRAIAVEQALARVSDADLGVFDPATVLATSIADDCRDWPAGDPTGPSDAPLPDVPALLLTGRLDLRTPSENAAALAAALPRAQIVALPGGGHDVLDTDTTGCAAVAIRRFAAGARVGRPCRGLTNAVAPYARPAPRLDRVPRAPGVTGRRGRVVQTVADTVLDAQVSVLQSLFGGLQRLGGGGLRGGWYRADASLSGLLLRRYSLVAGVRVSGRLRAGGGRLAGTVSVDGPGGLDGRLTLGPGGGAHGTVGGKRVRTRRARGRAVSASSAGRAGTAGHARVARAWREAAASAARRRAVDGF